MTSSSGTPVPGDTILTDEGIISDNYLRIYTGDDFLRVHSVSSDRLERVLSGRATVASGSPLGPSNRSPRCRGRDTSPRLRILAAEVDAKRARPNGSALAWSSATKTPRKRSSRGCASA